MRVIAGERRGLKLVEFYKEGTRPTLDRVKENLFNIIKNKILDAKVLDVFSGTGNLAIEALSRGAKEAYINDYDKECIKIINKNISLTKYEKCAKIFQNDYREFIRKLYTNDEKFDIIFIDAPYVANTGIDSISQIDEFNILKNKGIVVLESDFKSEIPKIIGSLICRDERKYGRVRLSFWEREE